MLFIECIFLLHWNCSKCALQTTFYTLKWWAEWLFERHIDNKNCNTQKKIEKHTEQMRKKRTDNRKPRKMASLLINSIRFVLIRFSGCFLTCHSLPVSLLVCSFIHYFSTFQWLTYVFYLPTPCIITSWFMHIFLFVYSFDGSPSLCTFSFLFYMHRRWITQNTYGVLHIFKNYGNSRLKKLLREALISQIWVFPMVGLKFFYPRFERTFD